jgi:hypothetical protein
VFHKNLLALAGGALALALIATQPAFAQDVPDNPDPGGRSESDRASGNVRGESVLPGRIGGGRPDRPQDNRATRNRNAPPAPPTPEQILAEAALSHGAVGGPSGFPASLRHVGLYAYRRSVLERWNSLPDSRLAALESLEQLRVIEAGIPIVAGAIDHAARGIDTPKDYAAFVARRRRKSAGHPTDG